MQGHMGKPMVGLEAEGVGQSRGQCLYCGFPGEKWVKQKRYTEYSQDWIVGAISVDLAAGVVPHCLLPGPGVHEGGGHIVLVCASLIQEVVGSKGSGLLSLRIKGVLPG